MNDVSKVIGDASEAALVRFVQPIRDIMEWRAANPKLAEIPFNSTNKFQVSIHKQEGHDRRCGKNFSFRKSFCRYNSFELLGSCW